MGPASWRRDVNEDLATSCVRRGLDATATLTIRGERLPTSLFRRQSSSAGRESRNRKEQKRERKKKHHRWLPPLSPSQHQM